MILKNAFFLLSQKLTPHVQHLSKSQPSGKNHKLRTVVRFTVDRIW